MSLNSTPVPISSQTASTSSPSQADSSSATLQDLQTEQQALAQSFSALLTLNPTWQQLQAWHHQNADALANQQQLALDMAANSELEAMSLIDQPNIPANASPTLAAFLTTQTTLAHARAQIHNQLLNALPLGEISDAQISQMQQSGDMLFQQQQGTNFQLQAQQAETLASESAQQTVPLPPPLVLPSGISAQMAAFLTARNQLMRSQINFSNQYVTATSAVRDAAMTQWMQQNAALFQQLQTLSQNLSATTDPAQN